MSHYARFVAAALCVLALAACKPDEQTEKSRWGANLATVNRIGIHYPATKDVLNKRVTMAKQAWDQATTIADKEKRAAALQAVNESVAKLTRGIESLESKVKKVDAYHRNSQLARKVPGSLLSPALFRADRAVRDVKEDLRRGPFRTPDELLARVDDDNAMLASTLRPIEKLERLAKEKKK